ncbi:DnaJ domain-containing protein [Teredinibacter turnerae]|uniref:DnaJ domain-containing protein n=1 Tax=Teredinibacter turnerae TaxID=2426 RepID=UPI0003707A71|nr:DnaJ domain-containing protein [Teredinibacter turnerae]
MNIKDAAKLLSVKGTVTPEDIKKAYRQAAQQFHPDRNPSGAEMMKMINAAYDVLKDFTGEIPCSDSMGGNTEDDEENYSEAVNEALNNIIYLDGLHIEICGAWVWVSGETRKHKEAIKAANFKYASKKKCWYFRPSDWKSRSRGSHSMEDIRSKYGSATPVRKRKQQLDNCEA